MLSLRPLSGGRPSMTALLARIGDWFLRLIDTNFTSEEDDA